MPEATPSMVNAAFLGVNIFGKGGPEIPPARPLARTKAGRLSFERMPARYGAVRGALAGILSTGIDVLPLFFCSPGRRSVGLNSPRRMCFFMGGATVRHSPGAIKTLCLPLSTGCGFNPSAHISGDVSFLWQTTSARRASGQVSAQTLPPFFSNGEVWSYENPTRRGAFFAVWLNFISRLSNAVPWAAFKSPSANFWRFLFVHLSLCPPL